MAVQMPSAALLFMNRLVRISMSSKRLVKIHGCRRGIRTFSSCSVKCNENEGDNSESSPFSSGKLTSRLSRIRRRPLSPLERISGLLPQDALSPEVLQLRQQDQQDTNMQVPATHCTQEERGPEPDPAENVSDTFHGEKSVIPDPLPGESLLVFGELLVAQHRKKRQVDFTKMFQLQPGALLQSRWGVIPHDEVAGRPAGRFLETSTGEAILIRRPSLDEYVLFMKRGPNIAYPKDAAMILTMMDVTEGDSVLESGSGSGAMSLFLSRAVGSKGRVVSFEVREDHHKKAVKNYRRWRATWSLRRGEEWPDNVQFHNADVCAAASLLAGRGFHAVALDMIHPHLALPTVIPHLHPGAVCAVYLANITQVVDLLEGIRCLALPLLCERIIEVPIRDWLVAPALHKDGRHCTRKAAILDEDRGEEAETSDESDEEEVCTDKQPAFGSIPYIARPHPEQFSHTAFLIKLRKCLQ